MPDTKSETVAIKVTPPQITSEIVDSSFALNEVLFWDVALVISMSESTVSKPAVKNKKRTGIKITPELQESPMSM